MRVRALRVMLYVCILAIWAAPAHAQAIGSIFGKVTDPSGAVLPGVTVTVTRGDDYSRRAGRGYEEGLDGCDVHQ